MIYFIQDSGSLAIKIGVSKNPVARLSDLQTAHASKLLLIGIMDGMRSEEQSLHRKFHRMQGEWFAPTPDLMEYIHENAISLSALSRPIGAAMIVHVPLIQRIYIIRDIVLLVMTWLIGAVAAFWAMIWSGRAIGGHGPYPGMIYIIAMLVGVIECFIIARWLARRIARRSSQRHLNTK